VHYRASFVRRFNCTMASTASMRSRPANAHSAANEWVAALAQRLRDVET
jgi:hypothetical protein